MEIISWNKISPICVYRWNFVDDICGVCQEDIMGLSAECSLNNQNIDTCAPIKGICGHVFHKDCITKWLNEKNTCPLCNQRWKSVKYNHNSEKEKDKDQEKKCSGIEALAGVGGRL